MKTNDGDDPSKGVCPNCGGKVIVYPDDSIITCPKCGSANEPQLSGLWD
ncbi:MAG: hypothetical protein K6B14_05275 [Lachnospiraceae bacterium]|nr:hypothetical protein [Lachnospiraceae bacterium]